MLWLCIRLPPLSPEALAPLGQWAQQWSDWVSSTPSARATQAGTARTGNFSCLWLEVGASLALFGGHAALLVEVRAALQRLHYQAQLGLAPTSAGAAVLAAAAAPPALSLAALHAQLQTLPLRLLELPEDALDALRSSGLTRIGELLRLPAAAVARRFGPACSAYLARLQGADSETLPRIELAPHFAARVDFETEVSEIETLLFPLQRLLHQLQGYLKARDRATQRLLLHFVQGQRGASTAAAATPGATGLRLELRASQATREAGEWLTLARERFGALQLAQPVRSLQLVVREFVAPRILQGDLFSRAAEQAQQYQQVLDRLRARLGVDALCSPALQADYRPERAWCSIAPDFVAPADQRPQMAAATRARLTRPTWLYAEPQPLVHPGELLAGPERIESGWWDGADVARDYYLARSSGGARQWVYQDLRSGAWYAHGLWA